MLFQKQTIKNTLSKWGKESDLSNELKFILEICMTWLCQQGYDYSNLIKDFIHQHLHHAHNNDHIQPWIKYNMEAIINVFFEEKRFDVNTHSLLDAWLKTEITINDEGLIHSWHPYKMNYQVAIYLEKKPYNDITMMQLEHFLAQIGSPPLCYNIIHTPFSSFLDGNQIPYQTCPFGKKDIYYFDSETPIMLSNVIKHIPCIVFGGKDLNLSLDFNFKCYPSYHMIVDALQTLTQTMLTNNIPKQADYEPNDECSIQ